MVLYIIYNDIIVWCIIAAVICAAAAVLFFLLRSRKKKIANGEITLKNALAAGLKDNAEAFSGMYEAMYSIARGRCGRRKEVFSAWENAVAECGNDGFTEAFNKKCGNYGKWKKEKKYMKAAKKLVRAFFKAGIVRSHDMYVTADETTAEKYELAGDGIITSDLTYDVLAPFWQMGDNVLEKGVIR